MDNSNNAPMQSASQVLGVVWYEGTDALLEGEPVCYNTNYGVATAADGSRHNRVERPSSSNNMAFAGVADGNYSAKSGGQFIRINEPGSKGVKVALGVNTVIDTGILTFTVGSGGRFVKPGFAGRGSIVPRQTVTATLFSSLAGAGIVAAANGLTLTMTTTGIVAGDKVVLVGGEDDGTGKIVAGTYIVATVAVGSLTLTAACVNTTAAGTLKASGYAFSGNPRCIADLLTGEESGGVEFVSTPEDGSTGMTAMAGGTTYICGGVAVASADAALPLADAAFPGARKCFACLGTLTTKGVKVTPAGTGWLIAGTTLTTVLFDAAGEIWYGVWAGKWATASVAGATEA